MHGHCFGTDKCKSLASFKIQLANLLHTLDQSGQQCGVAAAVGQTVFFIGCTVCPTFLCNKGKMDRGYVLAHMSTLSMLTCQHGETLFGEMIWPRFPHVQDSSFHESDCHSAGGMHVVGLSDAVKGLLHVACQQVRHESLFLTDVIVCIIRSYFELTALPYGCPLRSVMMRKAQHMLNVSSS